MSKEFITTDPDAIVAVNFTRSDPSQDSDGYYTDAGSTIVSNVRGDLQPLRGDVGLTIYGLTESATHIFFPEERVTAGVVQKDWLEYSGAKYRVVHVSDYGANYPQEYVLEVVT